MHVTHEMWRSRVIVAATDASFDSNGAAYKACVSGSDLSCKILMFHALCVKLHRSGHYSIYVMRVTRS